MTPSPRRQAQPLSSAQSLAARCLRQLPQRPARCAIHTHTHMHAITCALIHVLTHMHAHMHIHALTCVYMLTHSHMHTHVHAHTRHSHAHACIRM